MEVGWGQNPGACLSMVAPESLCGILRFENHWFKAVVLKLWHTSESPGELVKAGCPVGPPSSHVAWVYISHMFLDDCCCCCCCKDYSLSTTGLGDRCRWASKGSCLFQHPGTQWSHIREIVSSKWENSFSTHGFSCPGWNLALLDFLFTLIFVHIAEYVWTKVCPSCQHRALEVSGPLLYKLSLWQLPKITVKKSNVWFYLFKFQFFIKQSSSKFTGWTRVPSHSCICSAVNRVHCWVSFAI